MGKRTNGDLAADEWGAGAEDYILGQDGRLEAVWYEWVVQWLNVTFWGVTAWVWGLALPVTLCTLR